MKKTLITAAVIAVLAEIAYGVSYVQANPSYSFSPCMTSSVGTSTLNYMTPGTGTTTLSCDTNQNINRGSLDSYLGETDLLLLQATASTTGTIIKVREEISQDQQDWYPISASLNTSATTTVLTGNFSDYQFSLSTSTLEMGGSGNPSAMRWMQSLVTTQPPTRYVRYIFYIPVGGGNAAIWASASARKQTVQNY